MVKVKWTIGIDFDVERIWVEFPYDEKVKDEFKRRLPSPRWSKARERWEFAIHWDSCVETRKIATKNGADLNITPELIGWATVEAERQATIPDVQSMDLVDLPVTRAQFPALVAALETRPFQTVGAAFAARNRSCLIADDPGLGKTLQTIAAVVESGLKGPILVVAPKAAAKLTWPQELARWAPGDEVIVLGASTPKAGRAELIHKAVGAVYFPATDDYGLPDDYEEKRRWLITSPNYLRMKAETDEWGNYLKVKGRKVIVPVGEGMTELLDVSWSAVIVDESHDTLAGCTGNKKKQSAQRQGLGALDVVDGGLRIALSGTPFRGKESYLWGQLNFLRPELFRSYWKWAEEHFDVDKSGFGWTVGSIANKASIYAEAAKVMIRRSKAEVAKDLPPKQYPGWPLDPAFPNDNIAVWLDMDAKQAKAYQGMAKSAAAEVEGGTLLSNGVLSELTRLKQFAGSYGKVNDEGELVQTLPSNKFDWVAQWLSERGLDDPASANDGLGKVVIVSQFTGLLDVFREGLRKMGIEPWMFTGATSDKDREAAKDDWQNNPDSSRRVMLLSTKAGGVSLTLDAADDMIILDETWSNADQLQVEDRIHRLSRMHQVNIWKVFSRNTIEERIARLNLDAESSIKGIMDGERGIEFLKVFLAEEKAAA